MYFSIAVPLKPNAVIFTFSSVIIIYRLLVLLSSFILYSRVSYTSFQNTLEQAKERDLRCI